MRKIITILLLTTAISSCNILKEKSKEKKDIKLDERIETKEKRKGDTVSYIIPRIKYKDTTIVTTSTQGTILKTYYNDKGEIYKSDCISSEIELMRLEMRSLMDQSKSKESSKEEKIDNTWIYIIAGLVFLCFCVFIVGSGLFLYFKYK